jgi:hypothetical protein
VNQPSEQELSKGLHAMILIAQDRLQKLQALSGTSSQSRI